MIKQHIREHWKHVVAPKQQIIFTYLQFFCISMLQFDILSALNQIILLQTLIAPPYLKLHGVIILNMKASRLIEERASKVEACTLEMFSALLFLNKDINF